MQTANPLQQFLERGGEGLSIVAIIGFVLLALLLGLAIQAAICWFLASCFGRIPREHRRQEPGLVWLLMIPCFGVVWNFFVFPRLAESYRSYFASVGRNDVGDCGYGLGLAYAIAVVVTTVIGWVPWLNLVNCLFGPALLVLLILFLVKAASLKGQVAP